MPATTQAHPAGSTFVVDYEPLAGRGIDRPGRTSQRTVVALLAQGIIYVIEFHKFNRQRPGALKIENKIHFVW